MGGVLVAARAGVHADAGPFGRAEALQHLVVEGDEVVEQAPARVELERQPAFGEVELYDVGAGVQAAADVRLGLGGQVVQEGFAGVVGDAVGWVEQAQRRRCDDRLLHREAGVALCFPQVGLGVHLVSERA